MPCIDKDNTISDSIISLHERDWDDDYWSNSGGARWAFFAIFVVLIIIVVLGTIRVNKKRAQHGEQPIYGTRWLTPPSYRQSQTQYHQPDHVRDPDLPSAYVPTYTATANEFDMGYYDSNGNFHPNPNAKSALPHPPQTHQRTGSAISSHTNTGATPLSSTLDHVNESDRPAHEGHNGDDDDLTDISRPAGPPPTRNTNTSLSGVVRPEGPPPSWHENNGSREANDNGHVITTAGISTDDSSDGPSPSSSSNKGTEVSETTIEKKR
ncbi:hypothetical protein CORT_0C02960 [Candida orthopsilosis Co 90-125]|uniref:Uncharacterized protein n=1 Tax=Candida orthopsilosis (strain 90-125) TaxID=1136231 RepID=H8X3N4_CANO9|nr:hypothetical protein CORT_0C02960 [Candida orthopsilosis Co 90-125]CCG25672.1 hypothetical protein CORT_0C02960 [Candida orthopsilosis Co 90-125]